MKLLLDTHAVIWWDSDPSQLSTAARSALCDSANEIWLSAASGWEMAIKSQLGKLKLRLSIADIVAQQQQNGVQIIPTNMAHVLAVETLPAVHKDPFDRLLIAHAIVEGAVSVSADQALRPYPAQFLW